MHYYEHLARRADKLAQNLIDKVQSASPQYDVWRDECCYLDMDCNHQSPRQNAEQAEHNRRYNSIDVMIRGREVAAASTEPTYDFVWLNSATRRPLTFAELLDFFQDKHIHTQLSEDFESIGVDLSAPAIISDQTAGGVNDYIYCTLNELFQKQRERKQALRRHCETELPATPSNVTNINHKILSKIQALAEKMVSSLESEFAEAVEADLWIAKHLFFLNEANKLDGTYYIDNVAVIGVQERTCKCGTCEGTLYNTALVNSKTEELFTYNQVIGFFENTSAGEFFKKTFDLMNVDKDKECFIPGLNAVQLTNLMARLYSGLHQRELKMDRKDYDPGPQMPASSYISPSDYFGRPIHYTAANEEGDDFDRITRQRHTPSVIAFTRRPE